MTYNKDAETIQFCRDMFAGDVAAKKNVHKYIPRLDLQEDDEYARYSSRPVLSDAPKRILSQLVALAVKDSKEHLKDYLKKIIEESLITGICGSLILPGSKYPRIYTADEIETFIIDDDLRSLFLCSDDKNTLLFNIKNNEVFINEQRLLLFGNPIGKIPFIFHTRESMPPLIQLCSLALDHYRCMADFRNAMHHSSLCTAWVAGFPKDKILKLGSESAWVADFEKATAAFLEFKPNSFPIFQQEITNLEKRMDDSLDTFCPKGSAETPFRDLIVKIQSSLSELTLTINHFMLQGPSFLHTFPEILRPLPLGAAEITALTEAWKATAITHPELVDALKQGKVLR